MLCLNCIYYHEISSVSYVSSTSGCIYKVHFKTLSIVSTHEVLPSNEKSDSDCDSGDSQQINCVNVTEDYCVLGSRDGFIRIWPFSFKKTLLEAGNKNALSLNQFIQPFKRQSHKMVKYTQTICWHQPMNCLSVFDHFAKLVVKG